MIRYYSMLILALFVILFSVGYLCFIIIKKMKRGKTYQIPMKDTLIAILGLMIGSFLFYIYVPDLPDVLSHHTSKYDGQCEIEIDTGRGAHVEANFEDNSIWFNIDDYYKAQAGSYYCKVEYFPHSDEGQTLKLYRVKGGKEILTK